MVIINGEEKNCAGETILSYLNKEGYNPKRVVVEKNLVIIPKEKLAEEVIEENDSIEILNFVGGG